MTDISLEPMLPATVEAPEPSRPRVLLVASAFACGGVAMFFVTLLSYYARARDEVLRAGESWLDGSVIRLQPPNMAMGTVVLSMLTVYWLVHSMRRGDRPNAFVALTVSLILGGAVVNLVAFILADSGLSVGESQVGLMVYAVSGSFIALMVVAMGYLFVVGIRLLGSDDPRRLVELATSAAMFWFVTSAVFSVIWYGVYITK